MITAKLRIDGMHCQSCKKLIEAVCREASGVNTCSVDFESGTAIIEADDGFDAADLVEEIRNLGDYRVEVL